ncbi:MAG: hypothetical protein WBO14_04925 [Gammaproteobacteria bacterium]
MRWMLRHLGRLSTSNQVLPVPAEADTVALISGWAAVRLSTERLLELFAIFTGW